jgi:glycosyltransferase involved in cell wall biosynthesis
VKRKHIVIVYNEDPFSRDFGGNLRVRHLINELSKHMKVSLVSLPSPIIKPVKSKSFKYYIDRWIRTLLSKLNRKPETVNRHYYQIPKLNKKLQKFLRQNNVDFIQVEHSYFGEVLNNIDEKYAKILDFHNVHSFIKDSKAKQNKWKNFESGLKNKYDIVLCCSETEKQRLESLGFEHIYILKNAIIPFDRDTVNQQARADKLLFVGDMTYPPNQQAMNRFISTIMPKLKNKLPLLIIGKYNQRDFINELKMENIHFLGYTEKLSDYYKNAIFVCPINQGGGTRFKILESFIHRAPVISYAKGAEGIDYIHNENILIANGTNQFAELIDLVYNDTSLFQKLSENAFQLAKTKYNLTDIIKDYADYLNDLGE